MNYGVKLTVLFWSIMIFASQLGAGRTEWVRIYHFDAGEDKLPRVLLIGDSICNGYSRAVGKKLKGIAYVSHFVTSKCVAERSYQRELSFVLDNDEFKYDVIHFNNGLHSFNTSNSDWEAGLRSILKLLREKAGNAKIIWGSSTPVRNKSKTEKVKEMNLIAARVMKEEGIPINDLFTLTNQANPAELWTDGVHYNKQGTDIQGEQVAKMIRTKLGKQSKIEKLKTDK
jgi:hypothetical protein